MSIKLGLILEGIKNITFKDPKMEKLARDRAEDCANCNEYKEKTNTCGLCHCYIPFKIRTVENSCPNNVWQK